MGRKQYETEIREDVADFLKCKGYEIRNIASGSGVPAFSRLEITKDGETQSCSVKTSQSGRISFTRKTDGTYKVLSEVDLVLHVSHTGDTPGPLEVSMFESSDLIKAFDENWDALEADGNSHLPQWIGPKFEPGRRFAGSGYEGHALWRETFNPVQPKGRTSTASAPQQSEPAPRAEVLTIAEAKRRLALTFGVNENDISITING